MLRVLVFAVALGLCGCASLRAWTGSGGNDAQSAPSDDLLRALATASSTENPSGVDDPEAMADEVAAATEDVDPESSEEEIAEEEEDPGESREGSGPPGRDDIRYTQDLSDAALLDLWQQEPEKLGSLSLGFVDEGRLVNSKPFPAGEGWLVVDPDKAWATEETIQYTIAAIRRVRELYPEVPPLRINQISVADGGFLRPHKSHQNGRDVDIGFYYPTAMTVRVRARERVIHPGRNWAFVKALLVMTDVQYILVDKRIQQVLYRQALRSGENRAWVNYLFKNKASPIRHARGHRDHFHVRFFNPRAQELARRLSPILAFRPDLNVRMHRVKAGETLPRIARQYGISTSVLRRANRLKGGVNKVKVARVLKVPFKTGGLRGPVPPPLVMPPRNFPPGMTEAPKLADLSTPTPTPPDAANAPGVPASSPLQGVTPAALEHLEPQPSARFETPRTETPNGNEANVRGMTPDSARGGPSGTRLPLVNPVPAG